MRRTLFWIGSIAGVLLVLVVLVAAAVPLIDWNRAKPWVVEHLQSALGRDVAIDGNLHVSWHVDTSKRHHPWLPRLNVSAERVTIGNAPNGKHKQFAEIKAIDFDLLPWALLYHEIALGSIHAAEPVLHLERYADNKNNWNFHAGDDDASSWHLRLGRVAFDSGKFDLDDAVRQMQVNVIVTPLDKAVDFDQELHEQVQRAHRHSDGKQTSHEVEDADNAPRVHTGQAYRFAWTAKGKAAGSAVSGSGKIGGLLGLRDDEEPWPVSGELVTGDTHIALVGTLKNPSDLSALDLQLWLAGANMADLYPLLRLTLPQTKAFTTEGHLSGDLHPDGNRFSYENFRGRVGDSDLAGSITYDGRRERALLSGNIRSNLLQFADLGPMVGAAPSSHRATTQDPNKMLPTMHFHFERWKSMDAAVDFSAKKLVEEEELPVGDIQTHIALNNGVLTLQPLHFAIASGKADATVRVDGNPSPPQATFEANARGLQIKELFPGVGLMRASIGEVNGDVHFKTTGDSIAELLGRADGEIKLVVDGGSVSKAALEKAGLNFANLAITRLTGDEQVRINCAAADFAIDDGVLKSKLVMFDTDDALVRIDGTVSMKDERIDLTVHPDAKQVRLLSLRSPLHVTGSFQHAGLSVDKRALFVRGGGAFALAAIAPIAALVPLTATSRDASHSCPAVFARLREDKSPASHKPSRQ